MKSSIRLVGVTLLTGGLSLGGAALSMGAASADTGLKSSTSTSSDHRNFKDDSCTTKHNYARGYDDDHGRFRPWNDTKHWLDDNCNLRSDDDYNGHWTARDGCVHDYWGWWSKDGNYNWYKGHEDSNRSKSHDDGHQKYVDKKSDKKVDFKKPGKKS